MACSTKIRTKRRRTEALLQRTPIRLVNRAISRGICPTRGAARSLDLAGAKGHAGGVVFHVARQTLGTEAGGGKLPHEIGFAVLRDAELAAQRSVGRDGSPCDAGEGCEQK